MTRKRQSGAERAAAAAARAEAERQRLHEQDQERAHAEALAAMAPPAPEPSPVLRWCEYDRQTGRILVSREMPRDEFNEDLIADGVAAVETDLMVDPRLAYVLDGAIVARPDLPGFDRAEIRADGADAARHVLPALMTVFVDGVPHGPTAEVEIVSEMPATYRIEIRHFPFRDFAAEIVALPAEPA